MKTLKHDQKTKHLYSSLHLEQDVRIYCRIFTLIRRKRDKVVLLSLTMKRKNEWSRNPGNIMLNNTMFCQQGCNYPPSPILQRGQGSLIWPPSPARNLCQVLCCFNVFGHVFSVIIQVKFRAFSSPL